MQTALLRFGVKIMVTPYCLNEDTMLLSTVSQPKKVYTHDCGVCLFPFIFILFLGK